MLAYTLSILVLPFVAALSIPHERSESLPRRVSEAWQQSRSESTRELFGRAPDPAAPKVGSAGELLHGPSVLGAKFLPQSGPRATLTGLLPT